MRRFSPWYDAAIVFAIALVCYTWALGSSPLAMTEGHRAITAHQMVESGEWVAPRLYGRLYLKKPPLFYWILAAVEKASGFATEWSWRLPSAFASAVLAAALCLFTTRWFGQRAGLVAGLSCIGLVVLWSQSRSAEIDSMNTLSSALAACCLIELGYGNSRRVWIWVWGTGLMIGATLMLKGHTGLPVILGALFGPPVVLRTLKALKSPYVWIACLIGVLPFVAWVATLSMYLEGYGLKPDTSGITEAVGTLHLNDPARIIRAAVVPLLLLLYALPFSLAVPFNLKPAVTIREDQRQLMQAIAASILMAAAIFLVAGTTNPRYEYVIVPLTAPCVGALLMMIEEGYYSSYVRGLLDHAWKWLGVAFVIGHVGLLVISWLEGSISVAVGLSTFMAGVLLVIWIRDWANIRMPTHGVVLVCMLILLSVPFSQWHNHHRFLHSAHAQAQALQRHVGTGAHIVTDRVLMSKPELFFYSGTIADPRSFQDMLVRAPEPDTWIVLDAPEWQVWESRSTVNGSSHVCLKVQRHEVHVFRHLASFMPGPELPPVKCE